MPVDFFRRPAAALGAALAAVSLLAQPAEAHSPLSCLRHPARLSDATVEEFKARPAHLLEKHPDGGVLMSAAVRRLAGSNVSTVSTLCALANGASIAQVVALGVGLARTAAVCQRLHPDLADRIKEAVERAAITALTAAFAAGLASEPAPSDAAEEKRQAPLAGPHGLPGVSQSFFGDGGITRTIVSPVSPSR
jgi:hypothetical protein